MKPGRRDDAAARWYVEVLDQPASAGAEGAMLDWLEQDARNSHALARCEAAVQLAKDLAKDAEAGWAFREARWLATTGRAPRRRLRHWLANPVLAWSVAGLCAALTVPAFRDAPKEAQKTADVRGAAHAQAAERDPVPDLADTLALALVSAHPVVVLPGNVVVDANSLAVLPFSSGTDAPPALVAALHDDLVSALGAVPGLYAVGGETVAPYSGSTLPIEEVAAQLGTRGIVQGSVAVDAGRLSAKLSLTDAATGRVLLETAYERGTGDVYALEREMATAIALALAHATRPAVAASSQ